MDLQLSVDDYKKALTSDILTDNQIKLLECNYYASNHTITASEMARKMGFYNYQAANLHYGKLGKIIGIRLGLEELPSFSVNVLVSFEKPLNEWYWSMRKELVIALEELGWVSENVVNFIPEEIIGDEPIFDGAKKLITVNSYERNPKAKKLCIAHYGSICYVCKMNFEMIYGHIVKGYIHVHHKKPLSEIGEKYEINPIEDLVPLCPNCHAVIHMSTPPYTVEELKRIYEKNGKSKLRYRNHSWD